MSETENQPARDLAGLSMFCHVNPETGAGWGVFVAKMDGEHEDEDGERTYTFVASEPVEDRHRDVVGSDWKLDNFRANPVILWGHDASEPPIGRGEVHVNDAGQLILSVVFDTSELNPAGRLAEHQVRNGFVRAVSVGFISSAATHRSDLPEDHEAAGDRGYLLSGNELLEVSLVSIPALPSALHVNAETLPEVRSLADLQRVLRSVAAGERGPVKAKEIKPPNDAGLMAALDRNSERVTRHLGNVLELPDILERLAVLEQQMAATVERQAETPAPKPEPEPLAEYLDTDWWTNGWTAGG